MADVNRVPVRIRFNWDRYNCGEITWLPPQDARRITTGTNPPGELVEVVRDAEGNVVMDGNRPRVKGPDMPTPKPGEPKPVAKPKAEKLSEEEEKTPATGKVPPKKSGVLDKMIKKGTKTKDK